MSAAVTGGCVKISPRLFPKEVGNRLIVGTLEAMRRVESERPDVWARIDARAAEIRMERKMANGGK